MELKLRPSILSADFSRLGECIKQAEAGGAEGIHVDVMDGVFVPNLTYGSLIIEAVAKSGSCFVCSHLMVIDAEKYFKPFADAGVNGITVQQEAMPHLDVGLNKIKELGCKAGVAINPATPISTLECVLPLVDLVLVMTVNPGYGGQKLIPYCIDKVRALRKWRDDLGLSFDIQVDGGIKEDNVAMLVKAGANNFVAGSAIFGAKDVAGSCKKFIAEMKKGLSS